MKIQAVKNIRLLFTVVAIASILLFINQPTVAQMMIDDISFPSYPGGEEAMKKYLSDSLRYPQKAIEEGVEGDVIVSLSINPDGSLTNIRVSKKTSLSPEIDAEAIRLVQNMPRWEVPAFLRDGHSTMHTSITIPFKLPEIPSSKELYTGPTPVKELEPEGEPVFIAVEEMPGFPGSEKALKKYFADNMQYSKAAVKEGLEGRVAVEFIVAKDGSLGNIRILQGISPEIDKEALRLIENMPLWKPGKQNGRAVNVRYTLPLEFRLPKKTDNK